jgi:hypothetical protein
MKVKLIHSDIHVANYGGNKIPESSGLIIGDIYEVENVEVHSWHTKYFLKGFSKMPFNSVHFEIIEE